jgi:hypothetical protein
MHIPKLVIQIGYEFLLSQKYMIVWSLNLMIFKNPTNVICQFLGGGKEMCAYLFQFFWKHNAILIDLHIHKNNKFYLMENIGNFNLNCMASNMAIFINK